jgi:transcription termination/antitermination protein NusG
MLGCEAINWFAVQVTPRHETKVDIGLGYRGCERFLPTCKVRRNWSDRVKTLQQPLFPGYLFCRTTAGLLGSVLATPGVIRVISFGGKPCPVADQEIADLQRALHSGRPMQPVPHLSLGQRVQIKAGPLAGITGIITHFKNQSRLVLCVDSIMKAVAIDIDACDAVAVPATSVKPAVGAYPYRTSA